MSHEGTFEQPIQKFVLTRCEVIYKTCGTKNKWRKTVNEENDRVRYSIIKER